MKKKGKLEGLIWNQTPTSTREVLVSHALIRLQTKISSQAPFQGLEISLAKKSWGELGEDIQKQIRKLLGDVTEAIKKDGSDVQNILGKESKAAWRNAVREATADAIVKFALKGK